MDLIEGMVIEKIPNQRNHWIFFKKSIQTINRITLLTELS